jgi:hypothetical protein
MGRHLPLRAGKDDILTEIFACAFSHPFTPFRIERPITKFPPHH